MNLLAVTQKHLDGPSDPLSRKARRSHQWAFPSMTAEVPLSGVFELSTKPAATYSNINQEDPLSPRDDESGLYFCGSANAVKGWYRRLPFSHHLHPRDPLRHDIRLLATRHKASLSKRIQPMSYEHAYSQIIDERGLKINEVPTENRARLFKRRWRRPLILVRQFQKAVGT